MLHKWERLSSLCFCSLIILFHLNLKGWILSDAEFKILQTSFVFVCLILIFLIFCLGCIFSTLFLILVFIMVIFTMCFCLIIFFSLGYPGFLLDLHTKISKSTRERSCFNYYSNMCTGHCFNNLCTSPSGYISCVIHEVSQWYLQGQYMLCLQLLS